ncbi:WcaF family extracellular polysaccharide biosynthesis acetyltransferase [Thermophagus sp. OGC60D27]|uniref:WcaF family extracellular polysaccharide biosynthesis acetyltransferase n=1 Tax=Thermophagus sp. OGC60D27 TaxID=3458415 RepID=UPI0040378F1F
MKVDLSKYDNSWYHPGRHMIVRGAWYIVNGLFFLNPFFPFSGLKRRMLRFFGAKIGKGVVIKPRVNIKYPWRLTVGDYTWLGEEVWIDNLAQVNIGAHCCLSQGAMILCGNHDFSKTTFDLMVGPIVLEDGVWIGAKSIVTGKTTCLSHSVLAVNSVAGGKLEAYGVYRGNPAEKVKQREIKNKGKH